MRDSHVAASAWPAPGDAALVNDVVVGNEHDAPSFTIGTLELVQQVDEQQRVLVVLLGWIQRIG